MYIHSVWKSRARIRTQQTSAAASVGCWPAHMHAYPDVHTLCTCMSAMTTTPLGASPSSTGHEHLENQNTPTSA